MQKYHFTGQDFEFYKLRAQKIGDNPNARNFGQKILPYKQAPIESRPLI